MCLYSTHVHEDVRRNARVGENLTRATYRDHACLMGDDGKVTCIKPGSTLVIDNVDFRRGIGFSGMKQMIGKSIKVVLVKSMRGYSADKFELPNGMMATLEWLAEGTVFRIPRKARKDKGVRKLRSLDKVLGLDQIKADIPVDSKVDV
jgi:hypothetical protein